MNKLSGETMDLTQHNIENLKQLFPEVVTDGKIDFEKLKLVLGADIETQDERYSFTWNGKGNSLKLAQQPSLATLRPDKESSKNWDKTENLYIEGDNLEALKLLQKSYFSKIKMIYIDPPYNTGKDFVYEDNFKQSMQNYKEQTSQITKGNVETNGRYHTDWLNMMYPRLKLARNLLREDGVIFISIDENENSNLKKICDEIFGESNFIGEVIRKTKTMTGDNGNGFNLQHESLYIYCKNNKLINLVGSEKTFSGYSNPDNDPNGDWISGDPSAKSGGATTYFPIKNPFTNKVDYPPTGRYWAFSESTLKEYVHSGRVIFKESHREEERGFIFKRYKNQAKSLYNPLNSLFSTENEYMNEYGTSDLKNLLGSNSYFSYPKPVEFIKTLVQSLNDKDCYILDFFSGSATTAHAVMQLNAEDDGNRKFIMVQLPEKTDENSEAFTSGYENICKIGQERIHCAGDKIIEESGKEDLDIGFKVFKLDNSNIKQWNPEHDAIEGLIESLESNIVQGRTNEDLLYEIILKVGLPLNTLIETIDIDGNKIYDIEFGSMLMCLDDNITLDVVNEMLKYISEDIETKVVFKEIGFKNDSVKTNAIQTLKKHGIKEENIRSV